MEGSTPMNGHAVDHHTASAAIADEAGVRGVEGSATDSAMLVVKRGPNAGSRLYDRVHRGDVLWEAWERVGKNRGAAGVDRITLAAVEDYGVDRMLRELRCDLRAGVYRPAPARRVEIPKPRGGRRPLGIPTETA
jgi:hypothetical protein